MEGPDRFVVLVSGMPGAGKSTLAVPLAAVLGLPLVAKDVLKETLYDALPVPPEAASPDGALAWSRTLGGAAIELMWRLAADAPRVVLECNFRPADPRDRTHLAALDRPVVEVLCTCPPEVARARYAARATSGRHTGAHPMGVLPPGFEAQFGEPFGVGPVVRVDTTGPVDVAGVAARVLAACASMG